MGAAQAVDIQTEIFVSKRNKQVCSRIKTNTLRHIIVYDLYISRVVKLKGCVLVWEGVLHSWVTGSLDNNTTEILLWDTGTGVLQSQSAHNC